MPDDSLPLQWRGQQAVVALPERLDASCASPLRDRLLAAIDGGAAVLIADPTATASCDHAGIDALARAYQRAASAGTQLRLVVTAPAVRRVLSVEGLDRLVGVYPSVAAAAAAAEEPVSLGVRLGAAAGGQRRTVRTGRRARPGGHLLGRAGAAHRGYRAGYARAPVARPMGERARLVGVRRDGPLSRSRSP